jgi:hypothetical protein
MSSNSNPNERETVNVQIERLLDEREYAAITGRSIASVRRDRLLGQGCPFVKLNFLVKYRPSDVRAYIASNVRGTQAEARKSGGAEPRQ